MDHYMAVRIVRKDGFDVRISHPAETLTEAIKIGHRLLANHPEDNVVVYRTAGFVQTALAHSIDGVQPKPITWMELSDEAQAILSEEHDGE